MIYGEPVFRPGGDRCIEVYFGDEMSFDLNFLVHSVCGLIRETGIDGRDRADPGDGLHADQLRSGPHLLRDTVREVTGALRLDRLPGGPGAGQPHGLRAAPLLRSLDPGVRRRLPGEHRGQGMGSATSWSGSTTWTAWTSCAGCTPATDYWVAALGFWPGLCSLMPLDPRSTPGGAQIRSAADMDAQGHHRPRRLDHRDLSGPYARRLSDLRPYAHAHLGPGAASSGVPRQSGAVPPGDRVRFIPSIARSTTSSRPRSTKVRTSTTWSSTSASR